MNNITPGTVSVSITPDDPSLDQLADMLLQHLRSCNENDIRILIIRYLAEAQSLALRKVLSNGNNPSRNQFLS